mmetsp:Transcript_10216/g.24378  ORF Transcript_10216/g.24378 Transcript_10216/m.24378 type:complete len:84 (+) Transcript_10216:43-294(+)
MEENNKPRKDSGNLRRTNSVAVRTERAPAPQQGRKWEQPFSEAQKAKRAALAQAERTTGSFAGFDSQYGNYLLPVIPAFPSKG